MNKNITFLISYTPNPRISKRINLLKNSNKISLIFWNRFSSLNWGGSIGNISNYEIKIKANNGNPLLRIIPTVIFMIKALKILKRTKPDIIYLENLDMLIIGSFFKFFSPNIKIIYEIADLNKILMNNTNNLFSYFIKKLLLLLDKKLSKYISLLVTTSPKFYEKYFINIIQVEKYIFMPNIPEKSYFDSYTKKKNGTFTVGFIGAIRYFEQLKQLIRVCYNNGLKVLIAGSSSTPEIEFYSKKFPNVEYYGNYNYKEDISRLYSQIDCVIAYYDTKNLNVNFALPNKLYEAIICKIPIIVSSGTYLESIVKENNIGLSISNEDDLEENLLKLSKNQSFYYSLTENLGRCVHLIDDKIYNDKLFNFISNL